MADRARKIGILILIIVLMAVTGCRTSKLIKSAVFQEKKADDLAKDIQDFHKEQEYLIDEVTRKINDVKELHLSDYMTAVDYLEEALELLELAEAQYANISEATSKMRKLKLSKEFKEYARLIDKYNEAQKNAIADYIVLYQRYQKQYYLQSLIASRIEMANDAVTRFDDGRYDEAKSLFIQAKDILMQAENNFDKLPDSVKLKELKSYFIKAQEVTDLQIARCDALIAQDIKLDKTIYEKQRKAQEDLLRINWENEWIKYRNDQLNDFIVKSSRGFTISAEYWERVENYYKDSIQ
ncbi:MAG: hypothetical protein HY776_01880 [Actinobacteria bacterium]|nr:hypothetical protein [Actinomycetota bacterium]